MHCLRTIAASDLVLATQEPGNVTGHITKALRSGHAACRTPRGRTGMRLFADEPLAALLPDEVDELLVGVAPVGRPVQVVRVCNVREAARVDVDLEEVQEITR